MSHTAPFSGTTLVIESATEACSVALFDGADCVAGCFRLLGRGHAEALVPMIAELPGKGRAARIAVGLGPGSFTGVRIGLAAARALGLAWGVPVLGFPTLALLAAQARDIAGAQEVLTATTAGHGEWFVARFAADGTHLAPLAALAPEIAARAPTPLVAGNQAEALLALRGHDTAPLGVGTALTIAPDARAFALLPPADLGETLAPIYGRAPDARLPAEAARTAIA